MSQAAATPPSPLLDCPWPNCYRCIINAPKQKQKGMLEKALLSLPTEEEEVQESWSYTLRQIFDPQGMNSAKVEMCAKFIQCGVTNSLFHTLASPLITHTTRFHMLHAIKFLLIDTRCSPIVIRSPFFILILKKELCSEWILFREVATTILALTLLRNEKKITKDLHSSLFLSIILHRLFTTVEENKENWEEEGNFQPPLRIRDPREFLDEDLTTDKETNILKNYSESLREGAWRVLNALFKVNANSSLFIYELISNLPAPDRSQLFYRLSEVKSYNISTSLECTSDEVWTSLSSQLEIYLIILRPSFIDIGEKERLVGVTRATDFRSSMKQFITSILDENITHILANYILQAPEQEVAVEAHTLLLLMNLLEVLSRDVELAQFLDFHRIKDYMMDFITSWTSAANHSGKFGCPGFVEGFVRAPILGYSPGGNFVSTVQLNWIITSAILILSRLEREKENFTEFCEEQLSLLLTSLTHINELSVETASKDGGRFQSFSWSVLAVLKEVEIRGQKALDFPSLRATIHLQCACGWQKSTINAEFMGSIRKQKTLKEIDAGLDEEFLGASPSIIAELKAMKIRKSCSYCFAALTKSPMKCSRCKLSFFCDKDCQVKDWPLHKANCSPMLSGLE